MSGIHQMYSDRGHKISTPGWNLNEGLFVNCKYMHKLSRVKRVGNINPNHKSYLELYDANTNEVTNLLSHDAAFNEAIIADAATIITSDDNKNIYAWDIQTGKHINSLNTNKIVKKENFSSMPLSKNLTRINFMRIDSFKKEVYYSISGVKVIYVWNYEYNTNEVFESNMVKITSPFFTSDSTIIYKKGGYLELFDFKNQKVVSAKKENNQNNPFSFKYSKSKKIAITRTNTSLKLWNTNPFFAVDSVQLPKTLFVDNYRAINDLDYILLPISGGMIDMSSILQKMSQGDENIGKATLKYYQNPVKIKFKLYQIKDNQINLLDTPVIPGAMLQHINFYPEKNQLSIKMFNSPTIKNAANYKKYTNYSYDINNKTLKTLSNESNTSIETTTPLNYDISKDKKNYLSITTH